MIAEYVVAVYDVTVLIFKQSGQLLQIIENGTLNPRTAKEKYRYTKASVNIAGDNEIVILATNVKENSKTEQSRVLVLREKDSQEQINELLGKGEIIEAQAVFNQKSVKNAENFHKKQKEFQLNAGWQMFNTGQPERVFQFFKMSDVDPRELIVLFDDLTRDLRPTFNEHMTSLGNVVSLDRKYKSIARNAQQPNFDETQKIGEAKKAMRQLFHHMNQKYLSELRKDEEKQTDFMYSDYNPNPNVIKKEKRLLKDIVAFVQTALIRLYIDMDERENGRELIYEFFNEFSNGNQQSNHMYLLQEEMQKFLNEFNMQQNNVAKEAMALL